MSREKQEARIVIPVRSPSCVAGIPSCLFLLRSRAVQHCCRHILNQNLHYHGHQPERGYRVVSRNISLSELYRQKLSNEALRKHGILPPREQTPPSPSPPPSPTLDDILDDFTPSELQELGEDAHDDDAERYIAAYRQRVLTEMKKDANKARFGQVYPIGRDDYTREVTDASKADEPGEEDNKGTGVVCFLYKDG